MFVLDLFNSQFYCSNRNFIRPPPPLAHSITNVFMTLLLNFPLEYTIRRVQVYQDGLQLNDTGQLLVYADDINILGGSIHIIKENAKALVVASKEFGLEVNADKIKYVVMSLDQNAERSHSVKVDNISFERVEEFKYLQRTLTHQNSI